ncbi:recombinase family protein [Chryseobacterium fistulae]|uniref:DNA-invertase hin n=1 Tax=Chryseobacterium fistulae TaxID=2675058 RepID=A0A6N4XZK3_9FLAO|nr:recombinase family protein [Chryseobacterium fistulae]CAA7393832.1 DNA-invertase hin [Chryseobacterium fistulae]
MYFDLYKIFLYQYNGFCQKKVKNFLNCPTLFDALLIVYKLDRLGRSLKHLLEMVDFFNKKEVGLRSISDSIDTTTPQGRLFFNISASFAEFEKDLIRERTRAGLEAARARGRKGGRRRGMSKEAEQKAILVETYYREGKMSVMEIAKEVGISKMTLYKYLRHRNVPISAYSYKKELK